MLSLTVNNLRTSQCYFLSQISTNLNGHRQTPQCYFLLYLVASACLPGLGWVWPESSTDILAPMHLVLPTGVHLGLLLAAGAPRSRPIVASVVNPSEGAIASPSEYAIVSMG